MGILATQAVLTWFRHGYGAFFSSRVKSDCGLTLCEWTRPRFLGKTKEIWNGWLPAIQMRSKITRNISFAIVTGYSRPTFFGRSTIS